MPANPVETWEVRPGRTGRGPAGSGRTLRLCSRLRGRWPGGDEALGTLGCADPSPAAPALAGPAHSPGSSPRAARCAVDPWRRGPREHRGRLPGPSPRTFVGVETKPGREWHAVGQAMKAPRSSRRREGRSAGRAPPWSLEAAKPRPSRGPTHQTRPAGPLELLWPSQNLRVSRPLPWIC